MVLKIIQDEDFVGYLVGYYVFSLSEDLAASTDRINFPEPTEAV